MEIHKLRLNECHDADGLVVVIDVIRAFTTAAFAFASGAEKIFLVGPVEDAFSLSQKYPDALLVGENKGILIDGFHFGNSPVEMSKAALKGKTLIQRTSSGTQGVVRSTSAHKILTSSFVVAEATLKRIKALSPPKVSFVITGTTRGGEEDLALADYIESRLKGFNTPQPYLERVVKSPTGQLFASNTYSHFPKHDLDAVCQLDHFPFALEVFNEDGHQVLRPVSHTGSPWRFHPNKHFN